MPKYAWASLLLLGFISQKAFAPTPSCYYDHSYHVTYHGLAEVTNILIDMEGPIYPPANLHIGSFVRLSIENPVTWPGEGFGGWGITRYCYTIEPEYDLNSGLWIARWDLDGYWSQEVTYAGPLDVNMDGFVTGDDYDYFVYLFYYGCEEADYDDNGFVNGDDFDLFTSMWR